MEHSTTVLTLAGTTRDPGPVDLSAVLRALDTLVASAEPAVVFTSVVRSCVPLICHSARVTMTGPEQAYALTWPRVTTDEGHPARAAVRTLIVGESTAAHAGYCGTLTLHFHSRPTAQHAALAQLVVDRATALVHRERLTDLVFDATTRAANLDLALASNREIGVAIGVLMSLRKITRERAFEVLSEASQLTNRKLRDIAVDVIETGTFEPLVDVTSIPSSGAGRVVAARSGRHPITHCAS